MSQVSAGAFRAQGAPTEASQPVSTATEVPVPSAPAETQKEKAETAEQAEVKEVKEVKETEAVCFCTELQHAVR